jgi:DNA invertase Pin-like site-specific DNA recombinase
LLEQAVGSGVEVVIVSSVAVFHPLPAKALALAAMLKTSGVALQSTAEPWLADVDPRALAVIAAHLQIVEAGRASRSGRAVISRARSAGRRIGRPRKEWDRVRAAALVEELGSYRKAAKALGIGCTTLRRGLKAA